MDPRLIFTLISFFTNRQVAGQAAIYCERTFTDGLFKPFGDAAPLWMFDNNFQVCHECLGFITKSTHPNVHDTCHMSLDSLDIDYSINIAVFDRQLATYYGPVCPPLNGSAHHDSNLT